MRFDPLQRLFLVYSSGDSPPSQTSTTTTNVLYSPEEAARRAQVMSEAQRIYGTVAPNIANLRPAGASPETLQAQSMAKNWAQGAGSDMASRLTQATQFGLGDVLYPESNPALQATLDTATRRIGQQYTDPGGVLSNIRTNFTTGNTAGTGTRESIAGGIAGREYLNTIGDVTGNILNNAYNKGLDTFSRTMALAPQTMQTQLMPATTIGAVGQQNEAYAENQRQFDLNSPWMALSPYADTVMGFSNPSTQSQATVPGPQKNPMAPLGGAMMGASLGAIIPGVGPIAGAGAGLLLSLFS